MIDLQTATQEACRQVGITYRDTPIPGRWYTSDIEDKAPRNGDGRIMQFPDGRGGIVQAWGRTEAIPFFIDSGVKLNPTEKAERNRQVKEARDMADKELAERRAIAAKLAQEVWKASLPLADNPYLLRKQVEPTTTLQQIELDELIKIIGYPQRR